MRLFRLNDQFLGRFGANKASPVRYNFKSVTFHQIEAVVSVVESLANSSNCFVWGKPRELDNFGIYIDVQHQLGVRLSPEGSDADGTFL